MSGVDHRLIAHLRQFIFLIHSFSSGNARRSSSFLDDPTTLLSNDLRHDLWYLQDHHSLPGAVLALTATILSLLAYLAPTLLLHGQVALLVVSPSTELTQSGPSQSIDGPSVFLGVLGACTRPKNEEPLNCTLPAFSSSYDLNVLPGNAPSMLLSSPSAATPVFIAIALALSVFFLFSFTLISFREKMPGKMGAVFEKPVVQRGSALVGFFGFMIGMTAFLVLRMWLGKAVQDFNGMIAAQGTQGPKLIAQTGNAFTSNVTYLLNETHFDVPSLVVWVAYAFSVVPIIISLTKLNVKMTKA
ncbi:hypothetical protein NMY22_g9998 [Coprinellus aureogranulatus]|nr:hypothetical protein NMY22_g9998 [Coprinellus aureogranulatus]